MPSRTHLEQLAHRSQLAAGRDTTHVGDVNPDEVQQLILDHRDDLVRRRVEFAHPDRCATLGLLTVYEGTTIGEVSCYNKGYVSEGQDTFTNLSPSCTE